MGEDLKQILSPLMGMVDKFPSPGRGTTAWKQEVE